LFATGQKRTEGATGEVRSQIESVLMSDKMMESCCRRERAVAVGSQQPAACAEGEEDGGSDSKQAKRSTALTVQTWWMSRTFMGRISTGTTGVRQPEEPMGIGHRQRPTERGMVGKHA